MAIIISISIPNRNLKDLEQFDKISEHRKDKSRSETCVLAMQLFIKHNSIEINKKITDYSDKNIVEPTLQISKHMEFRQMQAVACKMELSDMAKLREQYKKMLNALELEIENRTGGFISANINHESLEYSKDIPDLQILKKEFREKPTVIPSVLEAMPKEEYKPEIKFVSEPYLEEYVLKPNLDIDLVRKTKLDYFF